jgi:carbon storage regulator CsrA
MLVLSRRPQEKIVFPHVGITVEVVSVSGQTVRVGVTAPRDILILRNEIAEKGVPEPVAAPAAAKSPAAEPPRADGIDESSREALHRLKNRLNSANLAIHLVDKQLGAGQIAAAEQTLHRALTEFKSLDDELAAGSAARQKQSANPNGPRALVVEDDENESVLLAEILRIGGFQVATALDGRCALEYLDQNPLPNVVLLDMRMPRCDGPTTLSAIRDNPRYNGLRIVAVSGTRPSDLGVPTGPKGIDRWFSKPLDPQRLINELKHNVSASARKAQNDMPAWTTV